MDTFRSLPKQWLVARTIPEGLEGVVHAPFDGWQIQTAPQVPVLTLRGADGADLGRMIGWVIDAPQFHRADTEIHLAEGETPEQYFKRLSGAFVMIWRDAEGRLLLREDASGTLPAIHAEALGAVGSTTTALEMLGPLPHDDEIIGLFEFPKRYGYLPFGVTPRVGAHRLMPNHALDLDRFHAARIWPRPSDIQRPAMTAAQARAETEACARFVSRTVEAIMRHQNETVLYLSGGHDSRMVLAAAQAFNGPDAPRLTCQTLSTKGGLDGHIAAQVAARTGLAHRAIDILPAKAADLEPWVHRAGGMFFDLSSGLVATVAPHLPPADHPIGGTGAELGRGSNWDAEDLSAETISLETIMTGRFHTHIPMSPRMQAAAEAWMAGLPEGCDAATILDLIKIEQVHGAWAGACTYGHPFALPSLYPFSGQHLNETILRLPKDYRFSGGYFRDYMAALAPELLEIPINRAQGLQRLKFWKHELRTALPDPVRRVLKPFRHIVSETR